MESDGYNKDTKDDKSIGDSKRVERIIVRTSRKVRKEVSPLKLKRRLNKNSLKKKNAKFFSALLTGLNRAFPFSKLPNEIFQSHLDTLFKITHSSNFNTSIQALVLINHIVSEQGLNSDRYYRTLYESLLDPRLANSSKQGIYLNLLFKSLKTTLLIYQEYWHL